MPIQPYFVDYIRRIDMASESKLIRHSGLEVLDQEDQTLLREAVRFLDLAYAPYSGFHVGAAILTNSGSVCGGANQENASYPLCMCAERVALYHCSMRHPGEAIVTIAIAVRGKHPLAGPAPPCGACLQVLSEYEQRQDGKPIRILLKADGDTVIEAESVKTLLPYAFDGSYLR